MNKKLVIQLPLPVTDSVGSTSETLSVSVADTTEYATVKVVTWYDDATLTNCVDNIIVNNSVECGVNTTSKLATSWEETEIWQNKWFSNSVVDLRVDTCYTTRMDISYHTSSKCNCS
jgi:hypothetical protein